MKKELNKNQLKEALMTGWSEEECKNGYGIFTSDYMNGALHIELIGDIDDICHMYDNDYEASKQAEKDGIKIIHDLPIENNDKDYGYFIDTIKNRKIIQKHLLERGIIWNGLI